MRARAGAVSGQRRGAQRLCHRVAARRQEPPRGRDARAGGAAGTRPLDYASTTSVAPISRSTTSTLRSRHSSARCACAPSITSHGSAWARCSRRVDRPGEPSCTIRARSRTRRNRAAGSIPDRRPSRCRPWSARGVEAVRVHRRAALYALLDPLIARYGRDELTRVEQCLRAYLREIESKSPDPRQSPSFLYLPGLPATPYFERKLFPWIEALEASTADVRTELLTVLPSDARTRTRLHERRDRAAEPARRFRSGQLEWLLFLSSRRAPR